MSRRIRIATDGSAIGNPGPGGWAAVLAYEKQRWTISGSASMTTAPEMELWAAIEALRSLDGAYHVELRTDSEYLVRGMSYLAIRWRQQGWRNSRGVRLRDWELWEELLQLNHAHHIDWRWVRGHNGHPMQTQADTLAYAEARQQWVASRRAA
jgi:ribonuclease HI